MLFGLFSVTILCLIMGAKYRQTAFKYPIAGSYIISVLYAMGVRIDFTIMLMI